MTCSEDLALLKRFVEKDRIYEFLVGLNIQFDVVRVQILGKEDLPSLNETLAIVCADKGRRGVMLETPTVDSSALMTRIVTLQHPSFEQQSSEVKRTLDGSRSNKDLLWCTYCKKPKHAIDK